MRIKIEPSRYFEDRYKVRIEGKLINAIFQNYTAACRVANAIADGSMTRDPVTIDYSECLSEKASSS